MSKNRGTAFARLAIVLVLAVSGVLAAVGTASAAPVAASVKAVAPALAFDINGSWTDDGAARPSIRQTGNSVVINLVYANRPTAFGTVVNATTISVNFGGTVLTGTLQGTGLIRWSNGTTWQKVFTGAQVYDIAGTWTDGFSNQSFSDTIGYLQLVFQNGRPDAVGFAVNATTIEVTFPGAGTYLATIDPAGRLYWSNNTTWVRPIIF